MSGPVIESGPLSGASAPILDPAAGIRRRVAWTLAVFGLGALAAVAGAPLLGPSSLDFGRVFDRSIPYADNVEAQIFFVARLPRVLAAAVVGARWPPRAWSSRRCSAIRWRRPSRWASRPAPRWARCWRLPSTCRSGRGN